MLPGAAHCRRKHVDRLAFVAFSTYRGLNEENRQNKAETEDQHCRWKRHHQEDEEEEDCCLSEENRWGDLGANHSLLYRETRFRRRRLVERVGVNERQRGKKKSIFIWNKSEKEKEREREKELSLKSERAERSRQRAIVSRFGNFLSYRSLGVGVEHSSTEFDPNEDFNQTVHCFRSEASKARPRRRKGEIASDDEWKTNRRFRWSSLNSEWLMYSHHTMIWRAKFTIHPTHRWRLPWKLNRNENTFALMYRNVRSNPKYFLPSFSRFVWRTSIQVQIRPGMRRFQRLATVDLPANLIGQRCSSQWSRAISIAFFFLVYLCFDFSVKWFVDTHRSVLLSLIFFLN